LTCAAPYRVIHRVRCRMVQGVDGGPAACFVAAFGGVQPLEQGPLAAFLDFGGKPDEAEEGAGPADGAFPETGGRGDPSRSPGLAKQGPAVAAGLKVGRGCVRGGHRQNGRQRDAATCGGHELVSDEQVVPVVDPCDVL